MTTEVIIMNREAVAIAADSAVTIQGRKVLNTANKLYMLAPGHAVGVVIYNNASFMGMSWELIIKLYRNYLKAENKQPQHFLHLSDYATDFMGFIERNCVDWVSEDEQKRFFIAHLQDLMLIKIFRTVNHRVEETILENPSPISGQDIVNIANHVIDEVCSEWENADFLYTEVIRKKIKDSLYQSYHPIFEQLYNQYLSNLGLDEKTKQRLWNQCVNWFIKDQWDHYSGIGFAGYGDKDLFPSFTVYKVETFFHIWLKSSQTEHHSAQQAARIFPLAQGDVVQTILSGVHPSTLAKLQDIFINQVGLRYQTLLTSNKPKLSKADIENISNQMVQEDFDALIKSLLNRMRNECTSPIMQIVQSLPKDELALMAETLVNITSYMRRVSFNLETVGGPTDVAVISKKDGFIWIKRKHYFDPEQNYHFFKE